MNIKLFQGPAKAGSPAAFRNPRRYRCVKILGNGEESPPAARTSCVTLDLRGLIAT